MSNAGKTLWWLGGALLLLLALYCAAALVQAGSIYAGERALKNLRFWGVLSLSSLAGSVACVCLALRTSARPGRGSLADDRSS